MVRAYLVESMTIMRAALRHLGLDFCEKGGFLEISNPNRIRIGSQAVEYQDCAAETVNKILQTYQVNHCKDLASQKGYRITEKQEENGGIVLILTLGTE